MKATCISCALNVPNHMTKNNVQVFPRNTRILNRQSATDRLSCFPPTFPRLWSVRPTVLPTSLFVTVTNLTKTCCFCCFFFGTRPVPAYCRQGQYWIGYRIQFWGVLNFSLCTYDAQLGWCWSKNVTWPRRGPIWPPFAPKWLCDQNGAPTDLLDV